MSIAHRIAACRDLLRHYSAVFRFYWQGRNSLGSSFFNEHEAEFLPAALSLQEKPVSPVARLTGRILMVLVVDSGENRYCR